MIVLCKTPENGDRLNLAALGDRIEAAGRAFVDAAVAKQVFALLPIQLTVDQNTLVSQVYDLRLVSKQGRGRWAYDIVKNSARTCPYCTFGEVYEIDHYLAKTNYRELNVCPANLVPICHACNHIKQDGLPAAADRYLLHPYFDVFPDIRWLYADLEFLNRMGLS